MTSLGGVREKSHGMSRDAGGAGDSLASARAAVHLSKVERMKQVKTAWQRPAFTVTGTGFEVTMYLGTQTETRA